MCVSILWKEVLSLFSYLRKKRFLSEIQTSNRFSIITVEYAGWERVKMSIKNWVCWVYCHHFRSLILHKNYSFFQEFHFPSPFLNKTMYLGKHRFLGHQSAWTVQLIYLNGKPVPVTRRCPHPLQAIVCLDFIAMLLSEFMLADPLC